MLSSLLTPLTAHPPLLERHILPLLTISTPTPSPTLPLFFSHLFDLVLPGIDQLIGLHPGR